MITGTEDAEVTASRASAAKFAAYEAAEWAPPPPRMTTDSGSALVDAWGNPISADPGRFAQDLAPGTMEVVPYGYKLSMLDPQHPNTAMPDFLKWALRSVGTGLGVSYNALGNDAEGVNYTSLRYFLGLEHDNWMELQDQFQDDLPEPVRQVWTATQIAMGTLQARPGRESQWNNVYWQARRWEGPDPAKQSQADKQELEIGSTTLTAILARKGLDFDDWLAERIEELSRIKEDASAANLTMAEILPYLTATASAQPPAEMPSDNGADPNA
jgi:capsid protein